MDRSIDPAIVRRRRFLRWAAAAAVVMAGVLFAVLRDSRSIAEVEGDKLTLATVVAGEFSEFIAVLGVVEPVLTVFIDATEGGRVEKITAVEGQRVQVGDEILQLSNDNLTLQIANYETEVARAINDLRLTRVSLENQLYQNRTQLIEYRYDIVRLERAARQHEQLQPLGGVDDTTAALSREALAQRREQFALLEQKIASDSAAFARRISAGEEMVESMQVSLTASRARLETLKLRARVAGELAALKPKLGEVIGYGSRIGVIHVLDSYKLRLEVDEHYVGRIARGVAVSCEFGGAEHPGRIATVYPEVRDGKFAADVGFDGPAPAGIRIGQTSRVRIALGDPTPALILPRGSFYATTAGQWVFVLRPAGDVASKRPIRLGRQNPNHYEILDGLAAGDRVIISDYSAFAHRDLLRLEPPKR